MELEENINLQLNFDIDKINSINKLSAALRILSEVENEIGITFKIETISSCTCVYHKRIDTGKTILALKCDYCIKNKLEK